MRAIATTLWIVGLASATGALAQDCRVELTSTNTASHRNEIVVAPSAPVTLQVHCNGPAQPTYRWGGGQATSSINVAAASAPGVSQAFPVDVTVAGSTQTLQGTVRSAAAGTPVCGLSRDPATNDVRVFTPVRITATCTNATSYFWTGGYDLRGQGTATATHVNLVNRTDTVTIDVMGVNENGPGPVSGLPIRYVVAPPACRILASPAGRVAPNTAVTLSAICDGTPTSYSWAHGATGASVVVNPAITASYTLRAANLVGTGPAATHTIPVSSTVPAQLDYTGHWWGGNVENGWGMTLNQHGSALFGVIYFYDATGEPIWAVMPGGTWSNDFTVFTANLYSPRGTPYTSYDASQLVAGAPVGNVTLTFANGGTMTASYELAYSQFDATGIEPTTFGQKTLVPLIVNSGTSPSGLAVPDMWWGGPAQNGWGISINQRSSEVFAAWFTYGADRRPTWFIISGSTWSGNTLSASLLRATGSPWLGVPYDATALQATTAGTASLTFSNASNAAFVYSTGVFSDSKAISRQPF